MAELRRPLALITGGSSGIGYELAVLFAKDGYDLVIVAAKKEGLDKASSSLALFGADVRAIAMDLSDPGSADRLFSLLRGTDVDVLVNNAGFGLFGSFHETDLGREVQMMNLNMVSLTKLTKLFLKGMMARRDGMILNIASTAAFQPGPLMAVYYATKAYVLSFSEALSVELEGTGVSVTALCPGPTDSGFQKRARMEGSKIIRGRLGSPAEVAKAGYDAMMEGRTIVIPGLRNKLLAYSVRLAPRKMVARIVRNMQERKK
ncbi:MAG: SDR family oxidoreductase [Candidatus Micrarchaeia archaeon]